MKFIQTLLQVLSTDSELVTALFAVQLRINFLHDILKLLVIVLAFKLILTLSLPGFQKLAQTGGERISPHPPRNFAFLQANKTKFCTVIDLCQKTPCANFQVFEHEMTS